MLTRNPQDTVDDLLNSDTGDKRSHSLPAKILAKITTKFSAKALGSVAIAAITLTSAGLSAEMITSASAASATSYELLLMARKRDNPRFSTNDAGHAWIALIRNDGRGWQTDRTFGFWPWGHGLRTNYEVDHTNRYLNGDYRFAPRGLAVRKIRLSPQRASEVRTILSNKWSVLARTNCLIYSPSSVLNKGICNCLDFSSRAWVNITGDWRSSMALNVTPDQFVDRVNWANRQTGDFVR
jgi:hypothetical protein